MVHDAAGDPRVGVVGASYGGALAVMLGATDPRVDSVVGVVAWNDLAEAFFPQFAVVGPGAGEPTSEAVVDRAPEPGPVSYTHLDVYKRQAYAAVGTALDLLDAPGVDELTVDALLTAIDAGRRVVNRVAAAQTLAVVGVVGVVGVVARERVEQEARRTHPSPGLRSSADPKVRESDARAGAAALVAGPLGIAEGWARDRVEHATRLCGAARSVLTAQRAGVLDPYRVGIVLNELCDARDDVAKQVADRLVPELVAALVENPSCLLYTSRCV